MVIIQRPLTPCSNHTTSIPSFSLGAIKMSWKWACEPAEVLACCYVIIYGKWQYYRELPPESWKEKIEKFKETFQLRDTDVLLGYIVVFDENDNISSVLAIVLYNGDNNPVYNRATVDFIDIDEWLRFVEQHSASP